MSFRLQEQKMKKLQAMVKNASGLSLIEVLLSIIIIATSAVVVLMWQKTSWSQTSYTNRLMVAGHVIEKQVEQRRMLIAQNPDQNFLTFKDAFKSKDSLIIDNSVTPPIKVLWNIKDTLIDPAGDHLDNVCWVKLRAFWDGARKNDTLQVITCIAKDF
jgi:type II secretory pathway pseudopilin PulG